MCQYHNVTKRCLSETFQYSVSRDNVTRRIAGCSEIVLCTPPDREGKIHPAILAAARIAGVSKIYKAGGVQAVAAMAYLSLIHI